MESERAARRAGCHRRGGVRDALSGEIRNSAQRNSAPGNDSPQHPDHQRHHRPTTSSYFFFLTDFFFADLIAVALVFVIVSVYATRGSSGTLLTWSSLAADRSGTPTAM